MITFFKTVILTGLILMSIDVSIAQKFIPYKDTSNGLWGIKNKISDKHVTKGRWLKIKEYNYNDSIFIVRDQMQKIYVIDTNGVIILKPENTYFGLLRTNFINTAYPYDTLNEKRLTENPMFNPRGEIYMEGGFFIDYQRKCYPADYYPCPAWRKISNAPLPLYLALIQKGEQKRWEKQIDSAVYYCKKAIEAAPSIASVYYWGAGLFLYNFQEKISFKNNNQYKKYYPWIKECLDKADSLENKNPYKTFIKYRRYKFYKLNLKDKIVAKRIKNEIKSISK